MQIMDGNSFLKTVPAVIGLAGLLTFLMREKKPASRVELVNLVRNVQTAFVLLGCTALILLSLWLFFRSAPPGFDVGLSRQGDSRPGRSAGEERVFPVNSGGPRNSGGNLRQP